MAFLESASEQSQGSRAWHEFRAKHIGASEVSAVLGESDYTTPYDLWLVKTGQKAGFAGNWATERGKAAEPEIRRLYEERFGVKLTAPVLEYAEWPHLSASLDGLYPSGSLVVEFKYPSKAKHAAAMRGEVPATYRAQLQAQLLVAGCKRAHYVSYSGSDIAVVEVEADEGEQRRILSACREFWRLVETKTPPPGAPVILESETLDVLAARFKKLDRIAAQTEAELKLIRQKLDEIVDEDKASFYGLTLNRTERLGSVDYSKVPELKGVDLEPYRRRPVKVLTVKAQE